MNHKIANHASNLAADAHNDLRIVRDASIGFTSGFFATVKGEEIWINADAAKQIGIHAQNTSYAYAYVARQEREV